MTQLEVDLRMELGVDWERHYPRLKASVDEFVSASKQAYGALIGASAADDSVVGRARIRMRSLLGFTVKGFDSYTGGFDIANWSELIPPEAGGTSPEGADDSDVPHAEDSYFNNIEDYALGHEPGD